MGFALWSCCRDSIVSQWLESYGSPTFQTFDGAAFPSRARGRRYVQNIRKAAGLGYRYWLRNQINDILYCNGTDLSLDSQ
jgi:hypothetical protein